MGEKGCGLVADALLERWEPTSSDRFDLRKAGHLMRRAALGGSLAERQRMVSLGVDRAMKMVSGGSEGGVDAAFERTLALGSIDSARAYRVWRMLRGRRRLAEVMSFFWHGHFATSNQKVTSPRMMSRQLRLFDRLGMGRFDELMLAVSRDPAMILWLDNDTNVKGRANENFARELFELFTLGRGNYTERDIREAARAFTGWQQRDETFRFVRGFHDAGEKTVFGKRGKFGGEEIIAMTVRRPDSARFLAAKLLAFFVHPEPTQAEINAVAVVYEKSGREIGVTVETILRSRLFFSERAYRSRLKSPADLAIGLVRSLGATVSPQAIASAMGVMGQALLEPPTVEGWRGEQEWITSATWLLRSNFAADLFAGRRNYNMKPVAESLLEKAKTPKERADLVLHLLFDGHVSDESRQAMLDFADSSAARGAGGAGAMLHAAMTFPEAQLL